MKKELLKYIPALFVLIALAVFFGTSSKSKDDLIYHQNLNWKLSSTKKDLLILGDSRVMFSSHPGVIANNLEGLNFAFPTNSYSRFYLDLAKEKLKVGSKVLLGISLESLTGRSDNAVIKSFLAKFDKGNRYLTTLSIYANMIFPSFDFSLFLQRKNPFNDYVRHTPRELIAHPNGWSEYRGSKIDESRLVWHYEKQFKQLPPKYEMTNNLLVFLKQMKEKGIQVYVFESPMGSELLAAERKGFPKREEYLNGLYNRLKSLGACHIRVSGSFKTYDGDHMLPDDAKRFSKILGEKIKNNDCEK